MTRWMIQHGARHIVLVSRSGSQDVKVQHLLDDVQGVAAVRVMVCDVSDEEQVRRLVETCSKTMPPICGVVNAAMALHVSFFSYDVVLSLLRCLLLKMLDRTVSLKT